MFGRKTRPTGEGGREGQRRADVVLSSDIKGLEGETGPVEFYSKERRNEGGLSLQVLERKESPDWKGDPRVYLYDDGQRLEAVGDYENHEIKSPVEPSIRLDKDEEIKDVKEAA